MLKTSIITITPNENNPRNITDEKLEKLKKSIREFEKMMKLRPIIVNKDGVVLGGNMRCRALEALGYTEIPDEWVKVADDLTPDEERRFIIEDNVAFGDWDWEKLANEWNGEELQEWGLDVWQGDMPEDEDDKEPEEDDFDADVDEVETRTKPGDKWQLGDHFLLCGDSTRSEDMERLMGAARADLIVTDPPYNVNYKSKSNGKSIQNDNMGEESFFQFLCDAFRVADERLKAGGAIYVWHADGSGNAFRNAFKEVGWPVKQCLIWKKSHFVLGRQDYQWIHEPCLYSFKEGAAHYFISQRNLATVIEDATSLDIDKLKKDEMKDLLKKMLQSEIPTTVIEEKTPMKNDDHPTMKPVKLIGRLVKNSSRVGEVVLDMFGGSGTTMVAAEQLGRRCYMMELDPKYCDVIVARWEKLTGKEARKI